MKIDVYKKCPMRNILAVLLVMVLFMISSCSNNEPETPQHDTVYQIDVSNILHLDEQQISRSADSSQVKNIIFRVRPGSDWEGINMEGVNFNLQRAFRAAKGKGIAEGTFRNVTVNPLSLQYADSIIALGFKVEFKNP